MQIRATTAEAPVPAAVEPTVTPSPAAIARRNHIAARMRAAALPWAGGILLVTIGLTLLIPAGKAAVPLALLAAAGAMLLSLGTLRRAPPAARAPADPVAVERIGRLGDRLERTVEQLADMQWKLRDNEARYRDLLDSQQDVIMRRDVDGKLIFVNSAFTRAFGGEAAAALGRRFEPTLTDGVAPTGDIVVSGERRRNYLQCIETSAGPRWFAVEDYVVATETSATAEIQTVLRDVTEQREAERQLQEARDAALSANRAKSRFLAMMSHEIRTPLNGVMGMTNLILDTELSPEQSTYARAIKQSSKTLLSLIDEILDFSKIEAGRLSLELAPFAIDDAIEGVAELLSPRAHEKGIEVAWRIDPTLPRMLIGDEIKLRQILINLAGNAIKFTDAGGVSIEAGRAEAAAPAGKVALSIAVRDTGIGLSAQAQGEIFGEFVQADTARARQSGGTGLGLAISKRLALAMGGDIAVESAPDQGAVFTLTVPLDCTPAGATIAERWPERGPSRRVLLALSRRLEGAAIAATLEAMGHTVATVDPSAPAAADGSVPAPRPAADVVIVDTGLEPSAARRLLAWAAAGRTGDHPLRGIILVDAAERTLIRNYEKAGLGSFLARPVRPSSLLAQVGAASMPLDGRAQTPSDSMPASESPRKPPAKPPRVLLAEDNDINALLSERMLKSGGAEVVRAATGLEAVEAVRRSLDAGAPPLDLVMMDVHMPAMDGLAAARAIRAMEAGSDAGRRIAIIALTANVFAEDRQDCLRAGMDGFLAKPFERSDIDDVLASWCRTDAVAPSGTES